MGRGVAWLTAVLLVTSLVSLFYYRRWIAPVLQRGQPRAAPRRWPGSVAVAGMGVALLTGAPGGPAVDRALSGGLIC